MPAGHLLLLASKKNDVPRLVFPDLDLHDKEDILKFIYSVQAHP